MKLICPKCGNTHLQYENTTIIKGELQLDDNDQLIKDTIQSINDRFYCLKCDFNTKNITDFNVSEP
jgi:predicted nucleic-acid-binding Zn-ribbon protein